MHSESVKDATACSFSSKEEGSPPPFVAYLLGVQQLVHAAKYCRVKTIKSSVKAYHISLLSQVWKRGDSSWLPCRLAYLCPHGIRMICQSSKLMEGVKIYLSEQSYRIEGEKLKWLTPCIHVSVVSSFDGV